MEQRTSEAYGIRPRGASYTYALLRIVKKYSLQTICNITSVSLRRCSRYDRRYKSRCFSNFVRGKVSTSDATGLTFVIRFRTRSWFISRFWISPGTSCVSKLDVSEGNWVPFSVSLSLTLLSPCLTGPGKFRSPVLSVSLTFDTRRCTIDTRPRIAERRETLETGRTREGCFSNLADEIERACLCVLRKDRDLSLRCGASYQRVLLSLGRQSSLSYSLSLFLFATHGARVYANVS